MVLFGVPLAIAVEHRNASDAVLELQRIAGAAAGQIPDGFADRRPRRAADGRAVDEARPL